LRRDLNEIETRRIEKRHRYALIGGGEMQMRQPDTKAQHDFPTAIAVQRCPRPMRRGIQNFAVEPHLLLTLTSQALVKALAVFEPSAGQIPNARGFAQQQYPAALVEE
jgi:hypothetical protein